MRARRSRNTRSACGGTVPSCRRVPGSYTRGPMVERDGAPTTIDEALAAMDHEIGRCVSTGDRGGYFAVVYRAVTDRVRQGIEAGEFADNERMEHFDVLFARRYLDACRGWRDRTEIPSAWRLAFEAADDGEHLVLQQLLLGINAHISFDLGLAAVDAVDAGRIHELRADFEFINDVLATLVDRMQDAIAEVSPWCRLVDRVGLRVDETLVCYVLRRSRQDAWEFAEELAHHPADELEALVSRRDRAVTELGRRLIEPPWPMRLAVRAARLRETDDLQRVIDRLR